MKTRKALPILVLVTLLVMSACAPATPQVVEKVVEKPVKETVVVEKVVEVVVTPTPAPEQVTLRVLSLPWPQTPVEQELANADFTPKTGIKVEISGPPY
ncbi:MAG: hypothetical protein RML36_00005, partial [Anaerolineae bacterium]|nr:hypothetical protein [Anaerolineae bacterium]